jgi:hypothetical protein
LWGASPMFFALIIILFVSPLLQSFLSLRPILLILDIKWRTSKG